MDSQSELEVLRTFFEASLEMDAALALIDALRAKDFEILGHPLSLSVEGEIDVAVPVRDASGRETWMLVEAKARLRASDTASGHASFARRSFEPVSEPLA